MKGLLKVAFSPKQTEYFALLFLNVEDQVFSYIPSRVMADSFPLCTRDYVPDSEQLPIKWILPTKKKPIRMICSPPPVRVLTKNKLTKILPYSKLGQLFTYNSGKAVIKFLYIKHKG